MHPKDLKKYLYDVLQTIDGLEQAASNWGIKDLEALTNRWILERGISIIGEAIYKAHNIDRALAITDKNKIIATRHIIIHDYDIVDSARLLFIIKNQLPLLKEEVENILKNLV